VTVSDDDRIAYLAGEPVDSLLPHERAELDELRDLLSTPATWEEPDPGLEDRVLAAVAQEVAAHESTAGAQAEVPAVRGDVVPDTPDVPAVRPRRAPSPPSGGLRAWFRRRPALGFGGLALAGAAVIAVVAVLATGGNSSNQLRFAMVVSGTSLAPNAHGSAELTKTTSGWRINLHATGLPHLENGRFYQAWVKNAQGILVPVGTFNDPENVTLWSGVPITQYRTLTVTTQQANGNPASSGHRVLIGTITPAH
jgi:hypothetical protein